MNRAGFVSLFRNLNCPPSGRSILEDPTSLLTQAINAHSIYTLIVDEARYASTGVPADIVERCLRELCNLNQNNDEDTAT